MAPGVPKYEINLAMWKTSGATSLGPRLLKWQILVLYRTVGEGEGGGIWSIIRDMASMKPAVSFPGSKTMPGCFF